MGPGNLDGTGGPCIIEVQVLSIFLWNKASHFFQKPLANRFQRLLSNNPTVEANIGEGIVGDLIPSVIDRRLLELEGRAVQAVVVRFEGGDSAHIEWGEQKGSLGWEEASLGRGVRGESVHDEKRLLLNIL